MAIVSRSCRLAGFYRLDFISLSLSSAALFLSHSRTHVLVLSLFPLPSPKGSILPRRRSFPSRRQTESEKGVPLEVLSGRYLEENSLFLARDRRNSSVQLDCRGAREEAGRSGSEDKRERASTRQRAAATARRRGSGKGQKRSQESCTSNVARREIASFPNPLCVFWLDWPPPLPVRSFSYISHPCSTPPSFGANILSFSLSVSLSSSTLRSLPCHFGPTDFFGEGRAKNKKG